MTATAMASPVSETKTSIGMPSVSRTTWSLRTDASGNGAGIGTSPPTTAKTRNATEAARRALVTPRAGHRPEQASRAAQADGHRQRGRQGDQGARDDVADRERRPDGGEGGQDLGRRQPRPRVGNEARGDGRRQGDGGDRPHHDDGAGTKRSPAAGPRQRLPGRGC